MTFRDPWGGHPWKSNLFSLWFPIAAPIVVKWNQWCHHRGFFGKSHQGVDQNIFFILVVAIKSLSNQISIGNLSKWQPLPKFRKRFWSQVLISGQLHFWGWPRSSEVGLPGDLQWSLPTVKITMGPNNEGERFRLRLYFRTCCLYWSYDRAVLPLVINSMDEPRSQAVKAQRYESPDHPLKSQQVPVERIADAVSGCSICVLVNSLTDGVLGTLL